MRIRLVNRDERGDKKPIVLFEGVYTIGRWDSCDIRIDHPTVSAEHCRIEVRHGNATVIDLGSTNGTLLNGERIEVGRSRALETRDHLTIGTVAYRVLVEGASEPGRATAHDD